MKDFFDRNPGLRSRVPFSIHFEDYSSEEMVKIVEHEAGKKGFTINAKADDKILEICKSAEGNPNAGNGRFCRNLVDTAILEYATRIFGQDGENNDCGFELMAEDFNNPLETEKPEEVRSIGFCL